MMTGEPCWRHFSARRAARYHVVSPMRAAGEGQNAFLQIDDNERFFCIEF
jgi:hypothetical protein